MSYHAANSRLVKKLDNKKKTIKMTQNQQPGEDTRKPVTELQKELDNVEKKYSVLERIHKYTIERDSERIWELLYRPIPSIQRLQDLERSLYEANKLVEKQHEEIRPLMNHGKLLEEEKIKMVCITGDDLRRQQAFTLGIYNFHQCQHTALVNLLIEANHAHLVTETTADHWRQRFEEEH